MKDLPAHQSCSRLERHQSANPNAPVSAMWFRSRITELMGEESTELANSHSGVYRKWSESDGSVAIHHATSLWSRLSSSCVTPSGTTGAAANACSKSSIGPVLFRSRLKAALYCRAICSARQLSEAVRQSPSATGEFSFCISAIASAKSGTRSPASSQPSESISAHSHVRAPSVRSSFCPPTPPTPKIGAKVVATAPGKS